MDIQELKTQLSGIGLPSEIQVKVDEVLDRSIAAGSLSDEDRQKLTDLVQLAMDMGNLQADAEEEMALAMRTFADGLIRAEQLNDKDQKSIVGSAQAETDKLEQEMNALGTTPAVEVPIAPAVSMETPDTPADQPMAGTV